MPELKAVLLSAELRVHCAASVGSTSLKVRKFERIVKQASKVFVTGDPVALESFLQSLVIDFNDTVRVIAELLARLTPQQVPQWRGREALATVLAAYTPIDDQVVAARLCASLRLWCSSPDWWNRSEMVHLAISIIEEHEPPIVFLRALRSSAEVCPVDDLNVVAWFVIRYGLDALDDSCSLPDDATKQDLLDLPRNCEDVVVDRVPLIALIDRHIADIERRAP